MRTRPSFRTADLEHLAARIAESDLDPDERKVWDELLMLGRDVAAAREEAEAARLVLGSTPIAGEFGNVADAFRRAFSVGARAIVGNVPPRR
jgi:hypothetical protein